MTGNESGLESKLPLQMNKEELSSNRVRDSLRYMGKNKLFDIIQKAYPKDTLGAGIRELTDPYDMVRFYLGYAEYLRLNTPLISQSSEGMYGVIGSTIVFRPNQNEAYKIAREEILKVAGEMDQEVAQNWHKTIEQEDLKFIVKIIKGNWNDIDSRDRLKRVEEL